jgi:lysozyme
MLLGVDVWSGYGLIDWHRVADSGVRFAIAKCTQGNDSCDVTYARNVSRARSEGILVGAYHFAYPLPSGLGFPAGRSPRDQAEKFAKEVERVGVDLDLPPALDLEWPARWDRRYTTSTGGLQDRWAHWGVSAQSIADWGLECLTEIERLFGRRPLLYTYPDFWLSLGEHGRRHEWAKYPLWIAHYTHPGPGLPPSTTRPIVPSPWSEWSIWQYSADGSGVRIPGIPASPIDRNAIREETLDILTCRPQTVCRDERMPIIHPRVPLGRPSLDDHDDEP